RRADPPDRISDRGVADPRGASLGGASAVRAGGTVARLLERGRLAARPGVRVVDRVESRAGDSRVRPAPAAARAGLRHGDARPLPARDGRIEMSQPLWRDPAGAG